MFSASVIVLPVSAFAPSLTPMFFVVVFVLKSIPRLSSLNHFRICVSSSSVTERPSQSDRSHTFPKTSLTNCVFGHLWPFSQG